MEWQELDKRIERFESGLPTSAGERPQFRSIWNEVKDIGTRFKETRYPAKEQRQAAWERFQKAVARLKGYQESYFATRDRRKQDSAHHKQEILAKAEAATPGGDGGLLYALLPPLLLVKMAVDMLPGPPVDEEKEELKRCAEQLKAGWALLSQYKGDMTGADKNEAFHALKKAANRLQKAWDRWKASRAEARESKRQAWESRQAERATRRGGFETRARENLRKNGERLEKLTDALARKERHIEDLQDGARSAGSESYRARVEGWIAEEEDRISDIKSNIRQVEGWIEEDRRRLSNV